jgi:invasion protein IalB
MIAAILAVTVLFAQAAPTVAPAPPTGAAPAGSTVSPATVTGKKAAAVNPNEVVCRREPVLGSLFPKEVCATRQQLTERTRIDQQQTREAGNLRPYKLTDGIGP